MPTTPTTPTTSFHDIVEALQRHDLAARSASADASQARTARNAVAVGVIKSALEEKVLHDRARRELLDRGILKGTVSKIITVLRAIEDGLMKVEDVKSLSGAYNQAKAARIAVSSPPATATATAPATASATIALANADDAVALILEAISNAGGGDPDAVFKAGGEWITRLTNEISDLIRRVGETGGDDDDE